jgi:ABC-type branched-subunit amino acid transport system ATPase component
MAPVLRACGLRKSFRGFHPVNGVDLDVDEGAMHALVGPNGAGKTTLFHLLTRFVKPSAGRILPDAEGGYAEVRHDPRVITAYLGEPDGAD